MPEHRHRQWLASSPHPWLNRGVLLRLLVASMLGACAGAQRTAGSAAHKPAASSEDSTVRDEAPPSEAQPVPASVAPSRHHRHTRFVFPDDGAGWRCTHHLNVTRDGLGQGVEYTDAQGNTLTLSVYPSPLDGDGPQRLSLPDELRQVTEAEVHPLFAEDQDPLVLLEYTVGRNAREPILRILWGMGSELDGEAVLLETLLAIFDLGSWRYRVLYVGEAGPTGSHQQVLRQVSAFAFDINPDDFTPAPAAGLPQLDLPRREPCIP